ncbi:hypothetical protein PENTCL1PPCAC_30356 [Pristionchus entomophagus]|uniref:MATH domain-containing protein n=1 Tax=Pristionchus entomophagus TaxID=358040 RepID=A0AAV5UMG3_9BILA|nr:hypothetical protein PENTCL1PPCAC_29946 [Pristionchus entomophagus]GMT08182.1 hypothetical protein PENTCL1PPCAC_30356 [Pristionchus entomophagus]
MAFFRMSPPRKREKKEDEEMMMLPFDNPIPGVIRFEIDGVSRLERYGQYSPGVEVGGVPWRARVCKANKGGGDRLFVYLYSMSRQCPLWSIDVEPCHFILVHTGSGKNISNRMKPLTFKFDRDHVGKSVIDWDDLMDERKGFIKYNRITVEIRFLITNMRGISRPQLRLPSPIRSKEEKEEENIPIHFEENKSVIIRYEVDEISTLNDIARFSSEIEVRGAHWSASIRKEDLHGSGNDSLLLYLHGRTNQSIDVEKMKFYLVHSDPSKKILKKMKPVTYEHDQEHGWGVILADWTEFIGEEKGFVNDDKTTVEIHFSIVNMIVRAISEGAAYC